MPRTYRRYTKTIVKAPKRAWNTGFTNANYDILTFASANNSIATSVVLNAADNTTPSATVIQCKHIKVYGLLCLQGNATQAGPATPVLVTSYIMYCPQMVYSTIEQAAGSTAGLFNTLNVFVHDHPEWIMSMKNVNVKYQGGLPGEHDVTKFTQTSGKMKRNLKSGDRILHIMILRNATSTADYNRSAYFEYVWNTRAN